MYELLDRIYSPSDVKKLKLEQLPQLAEELRSFLVTSVTETGGHLASNLGVVELTIALVYVYDFPQDKIIWDVGHQSYVYKILTGRKDRMAQLRTFGGLSGFPDRTESRYDCFNTGHASTSVSAALGLARAQHLQQGTAHIAAVIGDGALTGGMAWEALNDLGESRLPVTIVLNDNNMSIDPNVGGLSHRLNAVRLSQSYSKFKLLIARLTGRTPRLYRYLKKLRDRWKMRLLHNEVFEEFGVSYFGPVNGHDVLSLVRYFRLLSNYKEPAVLHVVTKKGKGHESAENDPTLYHGLSPKNLITKPSFSNEIGHVLTELAEKNAGVTVVTAAMTQGTGMTAFESRFPNRLFDVGIAEEHAVTMAAGLAVGGAKPYVAVYSTFLQRAYDQILHDVCLMDLPVTFCLDRAGVSNGDGPTHHGVYDVGYLSAMPNMAIYAPKNFVDLRAVLAFSVSYNHPLAIRYPKECVFERHDATTSFEFGKWEVLLRGERTAVVTYGDRMLALADPVCRECGATLVNAAFIKPLDEDCLNLLAKMKAVVVLEDAVSACGLFSSISTYYSDQDVRVKLIPLGLPNRPLGFGDNDRIFESCGITADALRERLR